MELSSERLKFKKRILLIGCSGAGKSTLSKVLGANLNIKVIHLDRIFWKPNWVKSDADEFNSEVKRIIKNEEWIIDGNFTRTLEIRAGRSDLILFFDFPTYFCLFRIFKRYIKTKVGMESRPDMTDGCKERIDIEFIKFVINFRKNTKPRVCKILKNLNASSENLIIFKSQKEVNRFRQNNKLV